MDVRAIRRLWVRLPNWVGDVVMAMPALAALREGLPAAEIVLGGRAPLEGIVAGARVYDRFAPLSGSLADAVRRIRAGGFDAAILFPRSFRTVLEARLGHVPVRIGYRDQGRGFLLTRAVEAEREPDGRIRPVYGADAALRLVAAAGLPAPPRPIRLARTPEGEHLAEAILAPRGAPRPRPWTLFIPGAAFGSAKCWPAAHFVELGRLVLARYGGTLFVLAGPGEEETARRIAAAVGPAAEAPGAARVPLSALKSMIARADLVVTNDTGPRHIAVAFDTPGIVLAGPMDPRHADAPQGRLRVLREPVPCSPCDLPHCPIDHRCLTRITPARVIAAIASFLD